MVGRHVPRSVRNVTASGGPRSRRMDGLLITGQERASSGKIRVLVTGGDHTGPLAAVRALRVAGYEPWAAASQPRTYAGRSRAAGGVIVLPDSGAQPGAFMQGLTDAAEKVGFSVILGGTERDLIALARGRKPPGWLAARPAQLAALLRITSKKVVNEIAVTVGLRIPPTIEMDRAGLNAGADLATPLILKPLRSELETSEGGLVHSEVQRVNNHHELRSLASTLPGERWLIQSCIEGQLGAICGVAWNGGIVCAVHQRAQRTWPVDIGVSAYAQTVPADPALEAGVGRLLGVLGWSGIFQAQFIHAENGPYLIDLNPRIYGSLALATAAGANLPAIWVALLTGSAVELPAYRVGVRYRAEELDAQALAHLLSTGRTAAAVLGLLPRRHTAHAVASFGDPLPMLTSLSKLRRRF